MKRTALLLLSATIALAQDAPRPVDAPDVGRKVGASPFIDALLKDAKAAVVALTASDCPVSKLYRPKIARLTEEAAKNGVRIAIVHCNFGDAPADGAHHDKDGSLAKLLGARRTTEVFVIDAARVLRYRGAVDDQYGVGYHREAPTKSYLADAIAAVLAGKPVPVPATEAPGCAIEREPKPRDAAVTYHRDVEPILQERCQECHRPGQIGPFSLMSYADAKKNSKRLKEIVQRRLMPPWHADPRHGAWQNDRRLTDAQIDTIAKWVDAGSPEGDAKHAPPARAWPEGWRIGTPDAIFTMPNAYRVPAEGAVPYHYARVKTDLKEDRWVQAMEVRPGARKVVHHVLVFVEYPRDRWKEQPIIDGGLFHGYFAVMVPGEQPIVFPEGAGKFIPAGATLVFQIHYTPNGEEARDQSSIGLVWAKEKPKKEVVTRGVIKVDLGIPPGAENHKEQATWRFPHDAKILSFMPHMHVRGKSFRYVAIDADGKEEILLDVPKYDFNWQTTYRLKEPKLVRKGTRLRCIAHFDNSKNNPANPDPKAFVRFGEQTWEEMLNGYVDYVKAGP